jgi:hypothetical protein
LPRARSDLTTSISLLKNYVHPSVSSNVMSEFSVDP